MTDQAALFAALDEGLAALEAGTPLAEVQADLAARYPALAADLRELLEVAQMAGAAALPVAPPLRAQARSRAALLGRAAALRQPRRRAWAVFSLPFARVALIAAVFLGGFAAGTYGAIAASADALPGEALYGIKRTVENTELLLTGDQAERTRLEATFTERRLEEVRRLVSAGRPAAVEFTGWLSSLEGEHWTISGLPVIVPAGTPVTGTPRTGVWVTVAGQVQPDRTVRATRVVVRPDDDVPLPTATAAASATAADTATPTRTASATATSTRAASATPAPSASATQSFAVGEDVEFTGVVESIAATAWQIGGQVVRVDGATEIRDNPQVGQVAEVRAVRQPDGSLLATRIRAEDTGGGDPSATNTPGSGGSGPSPSNTPKPEDGGGGNSGPSPSNTPEPEDGGGGDDHSGPSPSNTPKPDDDDGGGGNSGPSPSNTPKPDDD